MIKYPYSKMNTEMKRRIHVIIQGNVQGVNFRSEARFLARRMQLTGWVMNKGSTVELVAEGEEDDLKELLRWCQRGPRTAKVENIQTEWQTAKKEFKRFEVK